MGRVSFGVPRMGYASPLHGDFKRSPPPGMMPYGQRPPCSRPPCSMSHMGKGPIPGVTN